MGQYNPFHLWRESPKDTKYIFIDVLNKRIDRAAYNENKNELWNWKLTLNTNMTMIRIE